MKYFIDTKEQTLTVESGTSPPVTQYLYTEAAFETLSHQWMRVGWSLGYYSAFTWMERPILQLPQDLIHLQEIICLLRPDVVIETGVYQGGSLLYHATLCQALAQGRIIGIDISIPPGIRTALQEHPLGGRIGLIEGSSTSPTVVEAVKALLRPGEKVMVVLDSAHTCEHVRGELELYSSFVTRGSYLVVADGIMRELADVPGGEAGWLTDNPAFAVRDFLTTHPEFGHCTPAGFGARGSLTASNTYFTEGWLQRTP